MHPIDQADRRAYLKDDAGIGYCNITKCCTEVCPEHIKITDNAIIPLKERVADAYYDPLQWAWRKLPGDGPDRRPASSCRCCRRRKRRPRARARRLSRTRPRSRVRAAPRSRCPASPRSRFRAGPPWKGPASDRRRRCAGSRLSHPDRRSVASQSRPRLSRRRPHRPRSARRPRPGRATRRVDLRLPRRPDEQRRGVHGGGPLARPRLGVGRPGGPTPPRLHSHRRAAQRPLASQGRQAQAAPRRGEADPRRIRSLVGGPRPRAENFAADALCNEAIDRALAGGPESIVRRPGA